MTVGSIRKCIVWENSGESANYVTMTFRKSSCITEEDICASAVQSVWEDGEWLRAFEFEFTAENCRQMAEFFNDIVKEVKP